MNKIFQFTRSDGDASIVTNKNLLWAKGTVIKTREYAARETVTDTIETIISLFRLFVVSLANGETIYLNPEHVNDVYSDIAGASIKYDDGNVYKSDETVAAIIAKINGSTHDTARILVIDDDYDPTIHDDIIIFEGQGAGKAVTLPAIATAYKGLKILNLTAFDITISPAAGTIGGAATIVVSQYESVDLTPGGSIWAYSNHVVYSA